MKKLLSLALSLIMIIVTLTALPFTAHAKVITGGAGPSAEFIFDTSTGEMLFRGLPTGIEGEYAEGTIDGIYGDTTDDFDQDAYDEAIGIGITSMVFDKSISGIEIIWPFQGNPCVEKIVLNGQDVPARCFEGYTALTDVDISTTDYIGECAFACCPKLKSVSVGRNAEDIGAHAFGYDYSRDTYPYVFTPYDDFKIVSTCDTQAVADYISRYPEIKWQKVHDYPANGTVTKKASMKSQGFMEYTCNTCQNVKTVTIPKIKTVTVSPTKCTRTAYYNYPKVTVKDVKGKTLESGKDYTTTYSGDNVSVGTFQVIVKFKGKYTGQHTTNVDVVPPKTKIKKLKGKSKSIEVHWQQISSQGATGYQIETCRNKNFKGKSHKRYQVDKAKAYRTTIKKLSKKKRYYVRVRTIYVHKNGRTYASDWSGVWTVKTK